MNLFADYQQMLLSSIHADPVLSLAYTASMFDPLWADDDNFASPDTENDVLYFALHMLRKAFADVYLETLQAMQANASYERLETLICTAMQAKGIPLEQLEWFGYGIPLPSYGMVWDDDTFTSAYPEAVNVLVALGVNPQEDAPKDSYTRADQLADELLTREETHWRQIGWMLKWLFSCSGNSAVDYDYETMSEFQPLSWDADDVAFALDIIQEAEEIMADALAGLAFLTEHPELLPDLKNKLQKGISHVEPVILTGAAQRDERAA